MQPFCKMQRIKTQRIMSLNKVMLIGNVGKDPEVRYLDQTPQSGGSNAKVATFPLATSDRYRDRSGEVHENTEWHNIVAWRGNADVIERFVKKGTQLYIEGRLRTRSWTDPAGAKRYTTEVIVENFQLLGRRDRAEDAPGTPVQAQPAQPQPFQGPSSVAPVAPAAPEASAPEDDLPF